MAGCGGCQQAPLVPMARASSTAVAPTASGSLPVTTTPPMAMTPAAKRARELPATFMRGMTLSCPTWGPIWGRPETGKSMDEVQALGVDWVALHPYARVDKRGSVKFAPHSETPFLNRAVEMARARNIKLLWKPHLAYWGAFSWRGAIVFSSEAEWARFFDSYRAFIVDQARFAQAAGVEMFVVGLEYESTVHREADWRAVIAAVRDVYKGPITYSANWDGIDKVPFWDALDVIAVQAYFPLTATSPSDVEIDAGWDRVLAQLRAVSVRENKKILLAEIGYAAHPNAAQTPWKPGLDDAARPLRTKLLRRALERTRDVDFLVGAFWWKWMPGAPSRHDADFSMKDAEARSVLREMWGPTVASAPDSPSPIPAPASKSHP